MQAIKTYNNHISFKAKISPHFNKVALDFFNYGNFPNKMKNIYAFNQKSLEYEKYGYDNFVLDYEKVVDKGYYYHYMVAKNKTKEFIIYRGNNLTSIIRKFLSMNKREFQKLMRSKQ